MIEIIGMKSAAVRQLRRHRAGEGMLRELGAERCGEDGHSTEDSTGVGALPRGTSTAPAPDPHPALSTRLQFMH